MLGTPALAQDEGAGTFTGEEVDVSFDVSRTRLMGEDCRSAKEVNDDALRWSAFDPEGDEVLLTLNPQSGEIDSTAYVHLMDR